MGRVGGGGGERGFDVNDDAWDVSGGEKYCSLLLYKLAGDGIDRVGSARCQGQRWTKSHLSIGTHNCTGNFATNAAGKSGTRDCNVEGIN